MMRHQVKCPGRDDNGNPECKILYDMKYLPDLLRHIENEVYVKKTQDSAHLGVQLDRQYGFKNSEMDLRHVYLYRKNYFDDLESDVRKYVFKSLTAVVKPSVSRAKNNVILDSKSGYFVKEK